MPHFVRPTSPRIPNPVNPAEDFADRWLLDVRLEQNFWAWHTKIRADLDNCIKLLDSRQLPENLQRLFDVSLTSQHLDDLTKIGAFTASASKTATPLIRISSAPKPWRRSD
jgi:hypothetical protein